MKKLLILLAAVVMTANMMAQESNPTKFLGIPIDGSKQEMIRKIQEKGFEYDRGKDCLTGQFNGSNVNVFLGINRGKVWRVMVSESTTWSEGEIRIRFNNLLRQFQKNKKYMALDTEDVSIPDREDISYEMSVHNKRYSANFLQLPQELDSAFMYSAIEQSLAQTSEQMGLGLSLDSMDYATKQSLLEPLLKLACLNAFENNQVWFVIHQFYGEYYLSIYYDNANNGANGEDL